MKKFTKIISAVLLVSVLLVGAIVAVLADPEFDGVVADAQAKLDAVAAAETLADKRAAMDLVDEYVTGHTFDTAAEDYIAFDVAYKTAEKELRVAELTAKLDAADTAETVDKKAAYQATYDYLAERPLSDEELAEAELLDRVNALELAYVTLVIEEIEAGATADPVTVTLDDYRDFFAVCEARPLTPEEIDAAVLTERIAALDKDYILLLAAEAEKADASLTLCQEYYAEVAKREYDEAKLIELGLTADNIAAITKNYVTALIKEADSKEELDELFALTAGLTPEVIEANGWTTGLAGAEVKYVGILCDEAKTVATIEAYEELFNRIKDKGITDEQLTEQELIAKVDAAEISYAALLLDRVDVEEHGLARNGVYLNLFNYAHRELNTEHADYETYKTTVYDVYYNAKAQAQADAMAAARAELDSQNSFSDYNKAVLGNWDYDNNVGFGVTKDKATVNYSGSNAANEYHPSVDIMNEKGHTYVITEGADGNKYISFLYRTIKDPADPFYDSGYNMYTQTALSGAGKGNSVVIEFDMKTDSVIPQAGHYANGNAIVGGISMFIRISGSETIRLLTVDTNGDVTIPVGEGGYTLDGAIGMGGWTHFSFVLHASSMTADIYVNYEHVGQMSILNKGGTYELSSMSIRMDSNSSDGDFAIDNYQLYVGDSIRILDKYDNLTEEETFVLFGETLTDETIGILDRYDLYETMTKMMETWDKDGYNYKENADILAAIKAYEEFDLKAAEAAIKDATLAEFRALVEGFVALGRKFDNAAARKSEADRIQGIVHYYGNNIDRTNPEYIELEAIYQQWKADAVSDTNIYSFTMAMQQFATATRVAQKQKNYDAATGYYDLLDTSALDLPTFEPFREAYYSYASAGEQIEQLIREDNSNTIVICMQFLSAYNTEFEWDENEGEIRNYLNIVKRLLSTHTEENPAYDSEFEGITEAMEFYERINGYFYKKEQKVHAAKLTEYLNGLKLAESYVEKLTFVSAFEGYIALNDIDETDSRIIAVIENYEAELEKVQAAEEEYRVILAENTAKFKEAIDNMEAATTYVEKKAYYDEATEYYYVMTPGNAEEAIARYEAGLVYLNDVVTKSTLFVGFVEKLSFAADKDEMFRYLVECRRYSDVAESTLDGVADALVTYNALYNAYVDSVNTVKGEIDATQFIAGSSRANCGVDTIVKIIFAIIPTLEIE